MLTAKIHDDAKCHPKLQGQMATIDERRPWGAILSVPMPNGDAFARLDHDDFTLTPDGHVHKWDHDPNRAFMSCPCGESVAYEDLAR